MGISVECVPTPAGGARRPLPSANTGGLNRLKARQMALQLRTV
ncbi:hypothetical protein ATDW_10090 [Asticcacaulis sp. DW145]|nr:hypothetical protein ATDW_10090 [Asticcacaulis sp. DW145]